MNRVVLAALALVLALPVASAATDVKVLGGFFSPDSLQITVGEEVVWTNEDSMPHTVTSTWDGGESFDAIVRNGESFAWTFGEIGEFVVHCRPHAYPNDDGHMEGMVMTISVAAVAGAGNIGAPLQETPGPALMLVLAGLVGAAFLWRRR